MRDLTAEQVLLVAAALAAGRTARVRLRDGTMRLYKPDGTVTTSPPRIRGHHADVLVVDEAPRP